MRIGKRLDVQLSKAARKLSTAIFISSIDTYKYKNKGLM